MAKKLLIIGHTFPEPNTTAAGSRMLQLIRLFQEDGYAVTFASTASQGENSADLKSLGITSETIQLNNSSFDEFLLKLNPTIVLFDRFITEEQFGWSVSETCPKAVKILDTEDLHFLRKARETAIKKDKPVEQANLFTETAKRELASMWRCDLSLIISETEMTLLQKTFSIPKDILFYLPFLLSPISEEESQNLPVFEEREHFITIGNLLHAPNVDSVKILKKEIWPQLKVKLPKAELHIFGAYAPQQIKELHNGKEGFLIKGWAADGHDVMQQARICLAPIRFGAGLKGKLFDAMQCGTPFVTTKIGAEGIYNFSEKINNDEANWSDFINTAITLYTDEKAWLENQNQGFETLVNRFDKTLFIKPFLERIETIKSNLLQHRNKHFFGQILQHHTAQSTKFMAKWIEEKNRKTKPQTSLLVPRPRVAEALAEAQAL
ncbi:glycosyltransferase [Marixanthomonas spongiae]|uniref:Glycosyltransferase n=1 Tax=Marixanthomonas spongiae TaxID=2174845 RepID=A0A2U0I5J9_9FLAO|nr:glycosyltransferase [Marixanthomonas spongiae]PVW16372.1 glycosyltransferase [Marixanthomonas spongiae]